MRTRDLYNLNKMYDSLSYTAKLFFHPGFIGFEKLSPSWFLFQLTLMLSTSRIFKKTLRSIFPQLVFIPMVAINAKNEIVGFAFIKIKKKLQNGGFLGEFGIVVNDEHQGKGVGKKLTSQIIEHAIKEQFRRIDLTVSPSNFKAINLYKKYGFVERKMVKNGDCWRGLVLDCIELSLYLEDKDSKGM